MSTKLQELESRYNGAKAAFNRAQEDMQMLGEEIENLKKEEATAVKLKRPNSGSGERYWRRADGSWTVSGHFSNPGWAPNYAFASTNKAQAQAFYDAIDVMAELRTQPGIAVPDGKETVITIKYNVCFDKLFVKSFHREDFHSVSPAFKTTTNAHAAIQAVGEERIKAAFKTLMFMTPESRGEAA